MNKPKIRFKGFEGEWKEKALGDVVDEFKYGINAAAVSYDGENKYLRITDIDEGSRAFIKDELASPDADLSSCNEYIMQDGDIVIARTGASVGKSYIYHPIDGKVYFAGFLIRARVNKSVDRKFVFQNTLTDGFKKYIRFVSQRSGQPGVNAEELKSYLMNLPASLPEQRALASYFTSLDAQIAASTSRLSSLKQIKAASLLNMFPQKGETVPRVRFKGFQGEWVRQRLGDISASFSGGTPAVSVSDYYGGNIPFIRSGEIHENRTQLYITQAGLNNSSAKIVEKGTILYALYGATSGDVGISKLRGAINQAILAIEPTKDIDNFFLAGFLQSYKNRIINELLQGGQGNLSGSLVKKILLAIPSLPEQRAIASYFTALDAQITLHRERLEKLKQIKAACLEKMFA